jgi:hypothetical protein
MLSKSRNGSRKVRSNSKKQTNRGGGYSKKSVRSKSRSKSRKPLRSKSKKSLRSKSRKPLGRSKKQIKKKKYLEVYLVFLKKKKINL